MKNTEQHELKEKTSAFNHDAILRAWEQIESKLTEISGKSDERTVKVFAPLGELKLGDKLVSNQFTLELELTRPRKSAYQSVASLSVTNSTSPSKFFPEQISFMEISASQDEDAIELSIDVNTNAGMESRGLAGGLLELNDKVIETLMRLYPDYFSGHAVNSVLIDMAKPANGETGNKEKVKRKNWTSNVAEKLGFARDSEKSATFTKVQRRG